MQAVLLAFNRKDISLYLLTHGKQKMETIKKYTVLHLYAVHVLKAITSIEACD